MKEDFFVPHKAPSEHVQMSLRVSKDWRKMVDEYCIKHGCTITDLVISSINFAIARTKEPS